MQCILKVRQTRHGSLSGIQKWYTIIIMNIFCSLCFDRQWGCRVSVGKGLGIGMAGIAAPLARRN
jgi:hypothetical protein